MVFAGNRHDDKVDVLIGFQGCGKRRRWQSVILARSRTMAAIQSTPTDHCPHQFSLATLFGYTTICAMVATFSGFLGLIATASLMGAALALLARNGWLVLAMMMAACLSADVEWTAIDRDHSILRQLLVVLIILGVCCWQRRRRRAGRCSTLANRDHAETQIRRRLAGDLVHACAKPARPAAFASSGRRCARRTPARPVHWAWAASAAAWSTKLGHFPEVCKKSCRRWSPTCRAPSAAISWQRYSHRAAAALLAARAGSLRPADAAGARYTRGADHYRRSPGTRRSSASRQTPRARRPTKRSGTSAAAAATRPASCCNCSPGSTARTTSTIAATIATRPAASGWRASSAAARPRLSSKIWNTPTSCSSSAATRPATTRG